MLDILYEDKYLIAVNKEPKMLTIASSNEKERTLYHLVSEYVKKKNKRNKIFIIHRLDYDTSGIVLFAKDQKTKEIMQDNWSSVRRNYLAVVTGVVKKDHDIIKSYLKETRTLLTYSTKKGGKLAKTEYTVIKRDKNHSLLNSNLLTGRKNQIRVQLKDVGNPIVGDSKYGIEKYKYMLLDANELEFKHPVTNGTILIEKKIPKYFINIDKN
jgi:23S rRNA pseudouridine1911/1915/1917 synthase